MFAQTDTDSDEGEHSETEHNLMFLKYKTLLLMRSVICLPGLIVPDLVE